MRITEQRGTVDALPTRSPICTPLRCIARGAMLVQGEQRVRNEPMCAFMRSRRPLHGRVGAVRSLLEARFSSFQAFRGIWRVAEAGHCCRFASRAAIMAVPVQVERGHGSAASRPSAAIGAVMSRPPPRASHPFRPGVGAAQVAGPIPGRRPHQQFGQSARMHPQHRAVHHAPRFLDARRIDQPPVPVSPTSASANTSRPSGMRPSPVMRHDAARIGPHPHR